MSGTRFTQSMHRDVEILILKGLLHRNPTVSMRIPCVGRRVPK